MGYGRPPGAVDHRTAPERVGHPVAPAVNVFAEMPACGPSDE